MKQSRLLYLILSGALLVALLLTVFNPTYSFAQSDPIAETPTGQPTDEPPTATTMPTATTEQPTATSPSETTVPPTATPVAGITPTATSPSETAVPPAAPVSIPEPITVVLFGTGLAALSAAAASRRKNESNKSDE